MTRGDHHESLWADWKADSPQRQDDVVARWEWDEPEAPARRSRPQLPVRARAVILGVVLAVVAVALATALPARGPLPFEAVPSYWGDVTMTCDTARLEEGDRALELFRCRAVGGGRLPTGIFRSPESEWTSDLTRRVARTNLIEITPDGEVTGWAAY